MYLFQCEIVRGLIHYIDKGYPTKSLFMVVALIVNHADISHDASKSTKMTSNFPLCDLEVKLGNMKGKRIGSRIWNLHRRSNWSAIT